MILFYENVEEDRIKDIYTNNKNISKNNDKNLSRAKTTEVTEHPTHDKSYITVKWEEDIDPDSAKEHIDFNNLDSNIAKKSDYSDIKETKNDYRKHKITDKLENGETNNGFQDVYSHQIYSEKIDEQTVAKVEAREDKNKKANSTIEHKGKNKINTSRTNTISVIQNAITARNETLKDYKERVMGDAITKNRKAKTTKKINPIYTTKVEKTKGPKNSKISVIYLSHSEKENNLKRNNKSKNTLKNDAMEKEIIEVEVANGNGVNGIARRYKDMIEKKGFSVIKISNANSFEHITTKIFYYAGQHHDVSYLIKEIGIIPDENSVIELKKVGRKIKIIIGRDVIKQNRVKLAAK